MGEHEGWAETVEPLPNGLLPGASHVMRALDAERWMQAEKRTAELIACIQPNQLSEERRNAVADYVHRLIMKCFPCQVCTFGSVPLKTYLPDGDIDLTTFTQNQNLNDTWANLVKDILEREEKNEHAEFHVKEVQYIQAEVKIIKCLVENIVVDISFNQVGGLCTLCFLDEVDNLIGQNHLFKRSIILIKAWCYYESRILGAHHGLISTYALETLVLYIFHVFNNSFHGPLEVLYRFLVFFGNYDWDNFCVSLWGPVPINCLPDVTAEPPRKDSSELLLSKLFLEACGTVYAVFPGGQENKGQQFVSKHFNVIDPLRVSNNLGRSVSKGNFFRIRSAFAFGAKKLARLLDCPKQNLSSEVNQFFMNTWERHGSGHRPDAPKVDSWHLRLSTPDSPHESWNSNNVSSREKVTDQIGRDTLPGQVVPNDNIWRDPSRDHSVNDTEGRLLFARTHSSPELTDNYSDVSSQGQCGRQGESSDAQATYSRPDSSYWRKNIGPESSVIQSNHSPNEDTVARSQQSFDAADSNSVSNSYALSEEFSTFSGAQLMHQEDQDIVNMMASASLQGFNGQVHIPFNQMPGHIPYSIPASILASIDHTQHSFPGPFPTNTPTMDPSFSHVQFAHSLVSPKLTRYFPGVGINPSEDSIKRSNENLGCMDTIEANNDFLKEQNAGSPRKYDHENVNIGSLKSDEKSPASLPGLKYVPPHSRATFSTSERGQHKHPKDRHGAVRRNIDSSLMQDTNMSEVYAEEKPGSSRFSSAGHSSSLRSKTSSESSWDGSSVKTPYSTKEKRVKKISTDLKVTTEHVLNDADNYQELGSLLNPGTEIIERKPGSEPDAPLHMPGHHTTDFEVAQTGGSDSMMPFPPILIGPGSKNGMNDNSGLIAFYPTGPPVPFVTMLPVNNFPLETGTSDALNCHFGSHDTLNDTESAMNFKPKGSDQLGELSSSNSSMAISTNETSKERKADILNSDFLSHWESLQFGRVCQDHSPLMVPPAYVQGLLPYDFPGRPHSINANLFSQLLKNYGNCVVPVAPIQSVSSRHPNIYQSYMDDMPRYRSGTGTFLPNPKVSSRVERPSSGSRRGNYNHDRNDNFSDREVNWKANSKPRAARSHSRNQTERSSPRTERFSHGDGRSDSFWNSHRHNSIPSYQSQDGPLHSNLNQDGPQNVAYNNTLAAMNPNGVSNGLSVPPVMMLFPIGHNATYISDNEQLEFGSLGQIDSPNLNERSQLNDGTRARAFEDCRLQGSSAQGSPPDQPASPYHHRRIR